MLLSLILCSSVTLAQTKFPSTISIQGIVRDFSCYHPDFESPANWCKEQPGLLFPQLSPEPDSKPIPIPPELRDFSTLGIYKSCQPDAPMYKTKWAISNYGQFFFDEYYQDIPGVNIPIPIEITLNLIDKRIGLYRYANPSFFPVNDKGYIREKLDADNWLNNQVSMTSNFWFTTEFRLRFYYRGFETFTFNGDDDLWVFIDNKLTSCDLGGIHDSRVCEVDLQSLNLKVNTSHEMIIFHAERHFKGSSFEITTSIVPENQAPIVGVTSISLNEDSSQSFLLVGYDPDYNPLQYMILSPPRNGKISAELFKWYEFGKRIIYQPYTNLNGYDEFTYVISDTIANSSTGIVKINVNPVDTPPFPKDETVTVSLYERRQIILQVSDVDTSRANMTFHMVYHSNLGYINFDNITGAIFYEAVNVGNEEILWQVSDAGNNVRQAKLTIVIVDLNFSSRGRLKPEIVAGIVAGGIICCAFIGTLVAYFLFTFFAAAKFQKTWEREFRETQMLNNPLYKTEHKECFNPLYESSSSVSDFYARV